MDLLAAVKSGVAPIVVVDNLFGGPDMSLMGSESRHELMDALEANADNRDALKAALNVQTDDLQQLVDLAAANADDLWDIYWKAPEQNPYLQSFFGTVETAQAEIVRLKDLVAHLTQFFGQAPETFSSLESARDALSRCAIAFVDLFMNDALSIDQVLNLHAGYTHIYREKFSHQGVIWPKLVVLISTRIPGEEHLLSFRQGAGIRSAFFRAMNKRDISYPQVSQLLNNWGTKYAAAAALNAYLDDLGVVVDESAKRVIRDLDQIELHDLAVLDAARLIADGASLHGYISWLASELLAARMRTKASVMAANAPMRAFDGAVDTLLVKESVLFDLFADVTSTPAESEGHPQFGEIIAPCGELKSPEVTVYVALSPACDLARCSPTYEVLLLRGAMKASGRTAAELLQLGAVFGKGKHLLNYSVNGEEKQGLIKWDTKRGLITRPAGYLASKEKYTRLGRMAELFAYEVKELAISQVSRVGLPITPSVQRAGSVFVRARIDMGHGITPLDFDLPAPASPTVCALLTTGRVGDDGSEAGVVMLTEQFRNWFNDDVVPQIAACAGNVKVDALLRNIAKWSEWLVELDKNSGKPFADFTVKLVKEKPSERARGLEVLVITS